MTGIRHREQTRGLLLALWLAQLAIVPVGATAQPVRMLFVGDVLLGGRMGPKLATYGAGYPSAQVAPIMRGADVVFGNLEGPLTTATEATAGKTPEAIEAGLQFVFKGDPVRGGDALTHAGFTMMSVANNHAMDYRGAGLLQTLETLTSHDILAAGGGAHWDIAAAPRIQMVRGHKIAILACSMVNPPMSGAGVTTPGTYAVGKVWTPFLEEQVALLHRTCDFVIFTVHWGIESTANPTTYQTDVAQAAIAAGADLVIGHHPHVLQTFAWHEQRLIAYSMGNFIFTGKSKTLPSAILEIQWTPGDPGYTALLHPLLIRDGVPEPTTDPGIRAAIARLAPGIPLDQPGPVQSPR